MEALGLQAKPYRSEMVSGADARLRRVATEVQQWCSSYSSQPPFAETSDIARPEAFSQPQNARRIRHHEDRAPTQRDPDGPAEAFAPHHYLRLSPQAILISVFWPALPRGGPVPG